MLKILKGQECYSSGIVICEETKNASSLPFVLHFLATASENNSKTVVISSKLTDMNYKLICTKAGVRWNPAQIVFFEMLKPAHTFEIDTDMVMDDFFQKIIEANPSSVIFDDLSVLEHIGVKPTQLAIYINKIYTFLKENQKSPLLFCPFSTSSKVMTILKNRCDLQISIVPVGHGFGKDATAKAILTSRTFNSPTNKKGILLSGERTNNATWVSVD